MFLFPFRLAFRLMSFVVFAAFVYVVVSAVQVVSASRAPSGAASLRPASAIVVLGAPESAGAPGSVYLGRLEDASSIYQAGLAPLVLVTGDGTGSTSTAVAEVGAQWLSRNGVGVAHLKSLTASDAISGLRAAREDLGLHASVIVVTGAVELAWTKGAAAAAGLTAQVSPAAGSKLAVYSEFGSLWRQATGLAAGRIIGYSNTTWAAA